MLDFRYEPVKSWSIVGGVTVVVAIIIFVFVYFNSPEYKAEKEAQRVMENATLYENVVITRYYVEKTTTESGDIEVNYAVVKDYNSTNKKVVDDTERHLKINLVKHNIPLNTVVDLTVYDKEIIKARWTESLK